MSMQARLDALYKQLLALEKKVAGISTTVTGSTGITQLTGDVTGGPGPGSQATTIANDAVTLAKMANLAESRIIGRAAGAGTGDPTALTPAQVLAIIEKEFDAGASGSTKTIDWNNGRQQVCELDDDCTFTLSNPIDGIAYRLILVQDGTGGWTPTFPSSVEWETGSPPVWVTAAGNVIFVSLAKTAVGSGGYLGFATIQAMAQP